MKYIIMETEEGLRLPIIFPDILTHCFVAGAMQLVIDTMNPAKDLRPTQLDRMLKDGDGEVTSAGFVNLGNDVTVYGESESIGVKSDDVDALVIMIGEQAQFMPKAILKDIWAKMQSNEALMASKVIYSDDK